MTALSVNVNKIALLRNSRGGDCPNVVQMAKRCIAAGAQGITVHPRPDQRHIRYSDVYDLKQLLSFHPDREFNIEGNPIPQFLELVLAIQPDQCTLVPDSAQQLTSDHGWDFQTDGERLKPIIAALQKAHIRVSLFVDPVAEIMQNARQTGADRIELYTESYAKAFGTGRHEAVLQQYQEAGRSAVANGLGVNAGHDLSLKNLGALLSAIPTIQEVSIGHALIVESFDYTFEGTIHRYLDTIARVVSRTN
ncbi:MAG: pyridoxine 5'-phosphate synthase [Chitinivibrionales bacterium]|nr:pyridoxine 5'-phosphate synthase [Chitinivibrionales bacterium]